MSDVADNSENTAAEATEETETVASDMTTPEKADDAPEAQQEANADVFDRTYVEKLRSESAKYRDRAKAAEANADALSKRLHSALVTATGRLQDAGDLPYAPEHLDDAEAFTAAIEALIADKPHLKARKVAGDAGQGKRGEAASLNLLDVLKGRV